MISSLDNNKVKEVCRLVAKKKERASRGLFVAEGEKQVFEAPKERVESIFCTSGFADSHPESFVPGITEIVSDRVFAKMSDTDTPQGILAVVKMKETKPEDIYSESEIRIEGLPFILFLEDIRDPGNLGTIVRAAEAAGVTGIVMSAGTVDIYNPKTVRSTMGSIYRVPFLYADDIYGELERAKKSGITLYAAYLDSSIPYYDAEFTKSVGVLIGNEAAGLTYRAAQLADERIVIPMSGAVESLNAAVAAAVITFEVRRQRSCIQAEG